MNEVDPLVNALISLCEKEGGYKYVADKAKVSADNLWQIISGTKLPSGNPRGVGPGLRSKLTSAYPSWITGHAAATLPFTAAATGSTAGPTPPADYSPDALRLGKWFDKLPPDNVKTAQVYQDCMQLIINALHDLEQTPAPAPVARREKRPA